MAGLIAFTRSGIKVSCPSGKSVLELAEDLEIPIDSGCRAGNCGTCAVRLLKGSVRYLKSNSTELEAGTVLACIAQPEGEIQVEA
jgi:ferredoxin